MTMRMCFVSCTLSTGCLTWKGSHFKHFPTVKVFYSPTDTNRFALKRTLKFTLKQLLHVSVQSPPSRSVLFELAKVIVIQTLASSNNTLPDDGE